jgi:AI-2 transport protein TqsA
MDESVTPPGESAPTTVAEDAALARGRFSPTQRLLITVAAIGVTLLVMRVAAGVIVPVLLALVITMAVSPLLHWMIRHGIPPLLAWLVAVILTTAVVVCGFVLGGVGVARMIGELRGYSDELQARLAHAVSELNSAGIHVSGLTDGDGALFNPERVIKLGIDLLQTARAILGAVALTLLLVYFMLAEATTLQLKFSMTPPNVSPTLQRMELFTRDMRSFVQATTILGLVNGVAAGIFLWLLGVDFPFMWGVFAFLATFIPTLGVFIAVLPPAFLALLADGWKQALLVLLGYIVIFAITAGLRSGRFVGARLNLSPLAILLSIILWGWVLGLMGGLLAVPMTLLVRRLLVEAYDESRWITDLLGRPGKADAGAAPPVDGRVTPPAGTSAPGAGTGSDP